MHNRMHDWTYHLGFTEENWNAQQSNFGNAGAGGDPVLGQAQAGAATGGYPAYLGRDPLKRRQKSRNPALKRNPPRRLTPRRPSRRSPNSGPTSRNRRP